MNTVTATAFDAAPAPSRLWRIDGVGHNGFDDFCTFGNSTPFRVRIVNAYNDNQDYFYVKRSDASRVYGLELEHLLSPNRLNFITHGGTLIEEHVAGIPGDVYISDWLGRRAELKPIRVAKELVKFNERCFVRLLGDERLQKVMCRMRSLGCSPCTGAIRSDADTLPKIIAELVAVKNSERENRVIDHDREGSMELKKREGYF